MNYSKTVEEAVNGADYLQCGINENVRILRVVSTDWNDTVVADIFLSNGGKEFKWRLFPFNEYKGANAPTLEIQEEKYLQNIKHVFSKTVGVDNYDKAISTVTGTSPSEQFKSFINVLSFMSVDKAKDKSKPFRLMLVAGKVNDEGKQYYAVPSSSWSGGFCESMEVNPTKLKFDETKYGMKKKNSAKVETVSTDDTPDWLKS